MQLDRHVASIISSPTPEKHKAKHTPAACRTQCGGIFPLCPLPTARPPFATTVYGLISAQDPARTEGEPAAKRAQNQLCCGYCPSRREPLVCTSSSRCMNEHFLLFDLGVVRFLGMRCCFFGRQNRLVLAHEPRSHRVYLLKGIP